MEKTRAIVDELKKRKLKLSEQESSQFQTQILNMFSLKRIESEKSKILNKFSAQIKISEEIGLSKENLVNKLHYLHDTWMHEGVQDSEHARVICPILYKKLSDPLFLSLIGDGLTYFQNNEGEIHPCKALQIACLAGSSDIGNYLLKKYPNYITENFILPFSISSGNDDWVRKLATAQIENGLEFPKTIYLYGDRLLAKDIENMFLEPKPRELPKSSKHINEIISKFKDQLLMLIQQNVGQESEEDKQKFFQEFENNLPQLKNIVLSAHGESISKKVRHET
jgi:hypothetical protein